MKSVTFTIAARGVAYPHTRGANPAVTASGDLLKHLCRAAYHGERLQKRQSDPESIASALREKPLPTSGTYTYPPVQSCPTVPYQRHTEHCGLMASILVTYLAGRQAGLTESLHIWTRPDRGSIEGYGWGNCQKPVFLLKCNSGNFVCMFFLGELVPTLSRPPSLAHPPVKRQWGDTCCRLFEYQAI